MAVPQPNEHGVYLPKQCKSLILEHGRIKVRILVLKITPTEWKASSEVALPQSWAGGYPGIKDPSFPDRTSAILHEAKWIINYCRNSLTRHDDETSKQAASAVINWCNALRQPRLFDF